MSYYIDEMYGSNNSYLHPHPPTIKGTVPAWSLHGLMEMSDWVKVSDRLPAEGVWVLISQQGVNVGLGQYVNGVWRDDMDCRIDVAPTYWMAIHSPENDDTEGYRNENVDVKEKSFPKDEPSYWDKLHHQAAIAAMQAILSNTKLMDILGMQKGRELDEMVADLSLKHAIALVNKLKEDKQCEK